MVDTVKGGGFTWVVSRRQWQGDKVLIRQLDGTTFACYRAGRYLGSEPTLEEAFKRIKANKRREVKQEEPAIRVKFTMAPAGPGKVRVTAQVPSPRGNERKAALAALLKQGCTREEVLKLTGWPSVSMQQIARSLGVGLRIDKSMRPFRYYEGGVK